MKNNIGMISNFIIATKGSHHLIHRNENNFGDFEKRMIKLYSVDEISKNVTVRLLLKSFIKKNI
jgi:hypothetical protein